MEILPPYIYDLIMALEQYEDTHAKEGDCLLTVLALVPERQREYARAIAAYRSAYPADSEATP